MHKIRKVDNPFGGGVHYFHRFMAKYHVNEWFVIDEDRWRKYHIFESYQYDGIGLPPRDATPEQLKTWMDTDHGIAKMRKVIDEAGGHLIWEFNALLRESSGTDVQEYVRQYAVFGTITMKKVTPYEEKVLYPYLRKKAMVFNWFVWLYNQYVLLGTMNPVAANRYVKNGGTISTLNYGARQYMFKNIDGVLHENLLFFQKGWQPMKPFSEVPTYLGNYVKVKE